MILDLIEGRKTGRTPVWFMRQAGRFLPGYRKLREKYGFLQMCETPELAAEATLLPLKTLDFDAAILFSDILIPAWKMGMKLSYTGEGPKLEPAVASLRDVEALAVPAPEEYRAAGEAVKTVLAGLPKGKDLIGFSAAPYTLLTYMTGGAPGKRAGAAGKSAAPPEVFPALMSKLEAVIINCARAQIKAGVKIFQLFDTWAGNLSAEEYARSVMPGTARIISALKKDGVKVIYFAKDAWHLMGDVRNIPGIDVVSADAGHTLAQYDARLGGRFILQGNLDPAVLLGSREEMKAEIDRILAEGGKLKGHIFNLGHGVRPDTPPDNARFAVDRIHKSFCRRIFS